MSRKLDFPGKGYIIEFSPSGFFPSYILTWCLVNNRWQVLSTPLHVVALYNGDDQGSVTAFFIPYNIPVMIQEVCKSEVVTWYNDLSNFELSTKSPKTKFNWQYNGFFQFKFYINTVSTRREWIALLWGTKAGGMLAPMLMCLWFLSCLGSCCWDVWVFLSF